MRERLKRLGATVEQTLGIVIDGVSDEWDGTCTLPE